MNKPRIFADFHNADAQGRVRLNCAGTVEDLRENHITLECDLVITLYSEDLETDATVKFNEEEQLWVGVIDWDAMTQDARNRSANGDARLQGEPVVTTPK